MNLTFQKISTFGLLGVVVAITSTAFLGGRNLASAEGNRVPTSTDYSAEEAERTGRPPKSFMLQKLDSTQKVMKGLTTDNMQLVIEGSEELLQITEEASWKVSRDAYYIHYSRDFKRIVRDLEDAAKRGSVEEATFAYTHATVACMACHRHVRGVLPVSER